MHNVSIEKLLEKTGSLYKLVLLASMRAIELGDGAAKLVETKPDAKIIHIAMEEIAEGKVSYKTKEKK